LEVFNKLKKAFSACCFDNHDKKDESELNCERVPMVFDTYTTEEQIELLEEKPMSPGPFSQSTLKNSTEVEQGTSAPTRKWDSSQETLFSQKFSFLPC